MIDPDEAEAIPWRNGAGTTREVAFSIDGDGRTSWRISVADLDRDSHFSLFPHMDRIFVPLAPLTLTVDGVVTHLATGDQTRFAGESAVSVSLVAPTRALNVMTRRGQCRAEVDLRDIGAPARTAAYASINLGTKAADVWLLPSAGDTDG